MWIIGPKNQDGVDRNLIPSKYILCTDGNRIIEMMMKASEQYQGIGIMEINNVGEYDWIRNNGGFTSENYVAYKIPEFVSPLILSTRKPTPAAAVVVPVLTPTTIITPKSKPELMSSKADAQNLFFQDVDKTVGIWRKQLIQNIPNTTNESKFNFVSGIWWNQITHEQDEEIAEEIQRNRIPSAYFYQTETQIKGGQHIEVDFVRPYEDNRRCKSHFLRHDRSQVGPDERCLLALHALTLDIFEQWNNIVKADIKNRKKRGIVVCYVPELHPCFSEHYQPTSSIMALLYYRHRFFHSFYMQEHPLTWKFVVHSTLAVVTTRFTDKVEEYLLKKSLLSVGSPSSLYFQQTSLPSSYLYYASPVTLLPLSVYEHTSQYRWLIRYLSIGNKHDHLNFELFLIKSSSLSRYPSEFSMAFGIVDEVMMNDNKTNKQSIKIKMSQCPLLYESISIKAQSVAAKEYYYQDKPTTFPKHKFFTRESLKTDFDKHSLKLRMMHQILDFSFSSFLFMNAKTLLVDLQKKNRTTSSSTSDDGTSNTTSTGTLLQKLIPVTKNETITKASTASADKFIHLCRDTMSDRSVWLEKWMYSHSWTERMFCNDLWMFSSFLIHAR